MLDKSRYQTNRMLKIYELMLQECNTNNSLDYNLISNREEIDKLSKIVNDELQRRVYAETGQTRIWAVANNYGKY